MEPGSDHRIVLVGQVTVKQPEFWARYVEGVTASLEDFEARTILRGDYIAQLSGDARAEKIVLISFRDETEALRWFESDAYQKLISLREKAAITNIGLFQT